MPRRKEIEEILRLMHKTENIRNIGLVGHIDHGKTTLSDSLLSEAGLLSPTLAGEARALDYLEEEQKRGITMKSANISLYYEKAHGRKEEYLINLVDTPGHLDFSGKVTRALRLIDGVVVVVDAVEEIITQSETVIRQALQEGVKPVLFINKVDRLIRELKLTDDQIRKKYVRIIKDFNKLIERFADPPFNKEWQISPAEGNVAFGSALHKWGFTAHILENSDIKFKDIRERYKKETYTKESYADLAVFLPVHNAILEMVVNHLPNPIEAQKYRIRKIWDGDLNSRIGISMLNCDSNGPLVICMSKVQVLKHGLVATGRIFSGTCSIKKKVYLLREKEKGSINRLAIFMGQRRENVDNVPVGNIIAIEGFKKIKSGETIVSSEAVEEMIPFENVKYITTPVITVSIEPEFLRDLDRMKEIIEELLIEDPNLKFEINEENGEFLLSGTGPLHLEIAAKTIEERGVKISMSEARAVFKESCRGKSSLIRSESPDGQSFVELIIERLDEKSMLFFRTQNLEAFPAEIISELLKQNTNLTDFEVDNFLYCDQDQNVLIFPKNYNLDDYYKNMILDIIEKIHLNGPLCGEKLSEIKIVVKNLELNNINEDNAFSILSTIFYDAIKRGLEEAGIVLLEPIYHTIIQLPPEYIKNVTPLLSKYSAKIKEINQENEYSSTIEIFLPVRNSVKFANDVRSATSGRAFWQNKFYAYLEVPPNEANKLISDLKFAKGLSW
ncbi:MAG: GTP-binding protein [Promethearchaeota archaeon]